MRQYLEKMHGVKCNLGEVKLETMLASSLSLSNTTECF